MTRDRATGPDAHAPGRREHWEAIYATTAVDALGWYEREPATSIRLIRAAAPSRSSAIVDIGAGAASLVERLGAIGYTDLTVLDVSPRALDAARAALGERAGSVTFVVADVLSWEPRRRYDVWHDRAVFHFLTEATDRRRYVARAAAGVRHGGAAIVATFAEDGPTRCSGLAVRRYSARDLAAEFAPAFELVGHERETHRTPASAIQPFTWVVLRRA